MPRNRDREPVERVDAMARLAPYFTMSRNTHDVEHDTAPDPDPEPAADVELEPEPDAVPPQADTAAPEPDAVPDLNLAPELDATPELEAPVTTPEPAAMPVDPTPSTVHETAVAVDTDALPEPTRAELDKAPSAVAAMFDRVAARYDLVNDLLAVGQTRIWRRMVVDAVNVGPGQRVLDLAAGTGTSSAPFAQAGAEVVPCDFSLGMLRVGKQRQPHLPFVAGDALNLPFRDGAFDAVTISFGLRNVQDTDRALREMLRVTRPGGKLVICEFSSPVNRWFRTLYTEYLMKALPAIARRTASNPAAYEYLAESIAAWPDQTALADRIREAGWTRVQWRNATGGIVAIHRAYKPE